MKLSGARLGSIFGAILCVLVAVPAFAEDPGLLFRTPASNAKDNPAATAHAKSMSRGAPAAIQSGGPMAPSAVYTGSQSMNAGAVTVEEPEVEISDDLDNYEDIPEASIPDPLEPWNRFWFKFNDIFFLHVAKPVYDGWTWIAPQFFRTGVNNLFHNALFPTRFINSALQFRFMEAGVEFSRFMMNMMGSAGFVDLAGSKKTIVPVDPSGEDFGQTLGRWGFGPGFYLVWPFIGPSSLRDTVGRVGDYFTDPVFYINPWPYSTGAEAFLRFNALGDVLPAYEDLSSISIDPYVAMREAYASLRAAQIAR